MTKQQLSQLRHLHGEIALLKNQIATIEPQMTTEKVKGSMIDYPYILQEIKIRGVDMESYNRKLRIRKLKLQKRLVELENLVEEMNKFLEGVDDSLTRQILILRYVNGLSWGQVEACIGGGNKAESLRKKVERFLCKD